MPPIRRGTRALHESIKLISSHLNVLYRYCRAAGAFCSHLLTSYRGIREIYCNGVDVIYDRRAERYSSQICCETRVDRMVGGRL